jgi:hypothetical protein
VFAIYINLLFFLLYYPKAIASAVGSVAAIVNVSFPPLLFSVKVTASPATNLPFKKPGVVSFELTETLTSVSDCIAIQADPLQTFKRLVEELKYKAPVASALPSLSVDGAEDFAPKYVSSKLSKDAAASEALDAAAVADVSALVSDVAAFVSEVAALLSEVAALLSDVAALLALVDALLSDVAALLADVEALDA